MSEEKSEEVEDDGFITVYPKFPQDEENDK